MLVTSTLFVHLPLRPHKAAMLAYGIAALGWWLFLPVPPATWWLYDRTRWLWKWPSHLGIGSVETAADASIWTSSNFLLSDLQYRTPLLMAQAQRIQWTLSSSSELGGRDLGFNWHHLQISCCHGCAQSSVNLHSHVPVPPHGMHSLKTFAAWQTQLSSENSWRRLLLVALRAAQSAGI